jgi:hypothetical protein
VRAGLAEAVEALAAEALVRERAEVVA